MSRLRSAVVSFRIEPEVLALIDEQAHNHRMNRTQYITKACLHELPEAPQNVVERVEALEQRLDRLEALGFAG